MANKKPQPVGGEDTATGQESQATPAIRAAEKPEETTITATEEEGTAADGKAAAGEKEAPESSGNLGELRAFLAPYRKAYPKEKAFHVTSDRQVFLEKDRGLAMMHQNGLPGGEKVQTIPVK